MALSIPLVIRGASQEAHDELLDSLNYLEMVHGKGRNGLLQVVSH